MKITSVDNTNRLFLVEDVLPLDLVDEILHQDWINLPWNDQDGQEMWLRRSINFSNNPLLQQATQELKNTYRQVEEACGITVANADYINTSWWVDEPTFFVPIHTDGHLPATMQLFWHADNETLGTKFYNSKSRTDIRYDFPFRPNSGYVMLNGLNPDGSQPLQWHGLLNKVPENSYRLTSYTIFNEYLVR